MRRRVTTMVVWASLLSGGVMSVAPAGAALHAVEQGRPAALPHFKDGMDAQRREDWDAAARAYQRALEADPTFAEASANLGAVLSRLGRYDEAVAACEHAIALAPALNAARINLGLAHFRAGAVTKAVPAFEAALARDPASAQARALLGLALVDAGRDDEAIPHLEGLTSPDAGRADDPALLFALGRAYAARGDARGKAIATRLAALPAGRPLWHHLQGLLHQRQGRHREALAAFDAARASLPGQPALPGLSLATGISLLSLGEDGPAREAFARARAESPRDAVPLFYLAWVDERAGRLPEARQFVDDALAIDPELTEARALLGRILLSQGAPADAARHLALAAARDPEDASIRYLLAQAWQRAGDAVAARREFDEARRLKARDIARERSPHPNKRPIP